MTDVQANMQNEFLDSMLSDFLDESDQLIAQLNDNLLQLDEWVQSLDESSAQRCDSDLLNEMFRAAHSIKGLSAMLGLSDINTLTHRIENVFDAARSDQLTVNADVVDIIFMGLDRLTGQIELLKDPDAEPVDCSPVVEGIRRLLQSVGVEQHQSSQAEAEQAMVCGAPSTDLWAGIADDPLDGLQDEEGISEKYLAIFIDEAGLSLDQLSESLLALENGDHTHLHAPLAAAHKLKGSAASIGLNSAAKLAHLMEDLLEDLVQTEGIVPVETTDLLLKCAAALQKYVDSLKTGSADSESFKELARQLLYVQASGNLGDVIPTGQATESRASLSDRLAGVVAEIQRRLKGMEEKDVAAESGVSAGTVRRVQEGGNVKLSSITALAAYLDQAAVTSAGEIQAPTTIPPADTARPVEHADERDTCQNVYVGQVHFAPGMPTAVLKATLVLEKLSRIGEVIDSTPTAAELDELDCIESLRFRLVSDEPAEIVTAHIRVAGVSQVDLQTARDEPGLDSDSELTEAPAVEPVAFSVGELPPPGSALDTPSDYPPVNAAKPMAAVAQSIQEAVGAAQDVRPDGKPRTDTGKKPAETVRVDIERLDQLMDLTGQLVINKAQFTQIGQKLAATLDSKQLLSSLAKVTSELGKLDNADRPVNDGNAVSELQQLRSQVRRVQTYLEPLRDELRSITKARDFTRDLSEAIHQLELVSGGLQQGVMDTRMVPVGPLFTRFRRVVRDITRANGKQVQLVIRGEKTELDKRMIDELGDPLVHMVRNSADHGIELPDEREAAGKPRQGTVTLDAFHRGNSIVIQVCDDGKGLDTGRILRKCVDKGILTEEDAEKMTPQQIHQMIWEPGLTTAEKVTDVSGRGMGMDIVKSKIEELNGTVDVESHTGRGTRITIKLPLTLAILPSLMVEIGGDVFAMPLEAVIEIVSVRNQQLSTVQGRRTAILRDRVVSVVQLGDALRFQRLSTAHVTDGETVLVVLGEPGREIGLIVDRVVGEEDIVIKSIAENYKNIQGIAGASILGDGRVSLILDTVTLIDMASQGHLVGNGMLRE